MMATEDKNTLVTPTDAAQLYALVSSVWQEWALLVFGAVWFVLLLPLFTWLGWRMPAGVGKIAFFLLAGLLLALLLYGVRREWRHSGRGREHCALLADVDGLWPAHLDRARALVRWADIDDARYDLGPAQGALVLQGKGRDLLRIDRRLDGYASLCELVFQRLQRPLPPLLPAPPGGIRREYLSRWFVPALPLVFAVVIWLTANGSFFWNALIGLLLLITAVLAVWRAPVALGVDEAGVTLVYQGWHRPVVYGWDELADVDLCARVRSPLLTVRLLLKDGRSVALHGFSGDSRSHYKQNQSFPCMDLYRQVVRRLG